MGLTNLCLAALLLLASCCTVLGQGNTTDGERRYIKFIDLETNETRVIDLQEKPDYSVLRRSSQPSEMYLLFTKNNPSSPQTLKLNNGYSITSSNYNPAAQTVVLVHGWQGNQDTLRLVRDSFLSVMEANVIVLDWSYTSSRNYVTASASVPGVGRALGRFLAYLRSVTGATYNNMHLIGFSLGAHIVGNAGNYLNGRVARITGLDPAGPMWGILNTNRLSSNDAIYVEAIHTDTSMLGNELRCGDVDFFPNGGKAQPGCFILNESCSHRRSWQLFAYTVKYNHLVGRRCVDRLTFVFRQCNGSYLNMGNTDLNKTGNGLYYLKTQSFSPYRQVY